MISMNVEEKLDSVSICVAASRVCVFTTLYIYIHNVGGARLYCYTTPIGSCLYSRETVSCARLYCIEALTARLYTRATNYTCTYCTVYS